MICTLCPRQCGALRDELHGEGFCRMPSLPVCARAALHFWEEPCIPGQTGACVLPEPPHQPGAFWQDPDAG